MLFNNKSVATGMSSHPRVRCILPSLSFSRLLPRQRSTPDLTVEFRFIPKNTNHRISPHQISHSAGGI
jgi:hypothetical protein